jgi:hypothetical protein
MWGNRNGGDDNHDDRAIGPPMSAPEVPPVRIWDVVLRQNQWSERRVVEAHEIEMSQDLSVVRWREFFKDEQGMPGNRVTLTIVRPVDGWIEYEERKPEPKTQLVTPAGGAIGGGNVTLQ